MEFRIRGCVMLVWNVESLRVYVGSGETLCRIIRASQFSRDGLWKGWNFSPRGGRQSTLVSFNLGGSIRATLSVMHSRGRAGRSATFSLAEITINVWDLAERTDCSAGVWIQAFLTGAHIPRLFTPYRKKNNA